MLDLIGAMGRALGAEMLAHPVLTALWLGFALALMAAALDVLEHRGWRAAAWFIAAAACFAVIASLSGAEGSGAALGSGPG